MPNGSKSTLGGKAPAASTASLPTLLEDLVNKMAAGTLRNDGICIKMKTATGRNTPAVYVEDHRQNLLKTVALSKSDELHFENRCIECDVGPEPLAPVITPLDGPTNC